MWSIDPAVVLGSRHENPLHGCVDAHGGRDGHVRSSDIVDLDLKTPKEMGGSGGAGINLADANVTGH